MTAYNTTVTVLISMAIVIRECRQRRQRTDMERGIAPHPFKSRATGMEVALHNSIIGNFMDCQD